MPGVLDRQIDSLKTAAAEAPAADSDVRREYEDLLALAGTLYDRVQAGVRQWQASVTDWESPGWVEQARAFESRYRRLQETFERVAAALDAFEAAGGRADGAEAFRAARLDLDLLCQLSVDRMLKADQGLDHGDGPPMAEVREELRRRLGA
jgi:hypothetical protein